MVMQGLVFCCRLLLLGNFQAAEKNTLWNRQRKVKHAFVCLEMFITVVVPLLTCSPVNRQHFEKNENVSQMQNRRRRM